MVYSGRIHQCALLAATLVMQTHANCVREALQESADNYLASQYMGMPMMLPLGLNFSYFENDKKMDLQAGIINQEFKIDFARSIIDTAACATFTEMIIADLRNPRTIGTQIHYESLGKTIMKIDSIVTKPGDRLFNATAALSYALTENWDPILEENRDSRATIKAAGDAYMNHFSSNTTIVPWGFPCARLEGGIYFGGNQPNGTCNHGMPSATLDIANRRYVIDEVVGVVAIFASLAGNEAKAGLSSFHGFRIENGKIRYVHATTRCEGLELCRTQLGKATI